MELLVIGIVAILLFGKRLPEVGRSIGKGIMEFKKGLKGIEDEFHSAVNAAADETEKESKVAKAHSQADDREQATAPKFVPPSSEPKEEQTREEQPNDQVDQQVEA